jgi:hypothetical protein
LDPTVVFVEDLLGTFATGLNGTQQLQESGLPCDRFRLKEHASPKLHAETGPTIRVLLQIHL